MTEIYPRTISGRLIAGACGISSSSIVGIIVGAVGAMDAFKVEPIHDVNIGVHAARDTSNNANNGPGTPSWRKQ